jgi:hypothetical protein
MGACAMVGKVAAAAVAVLWATTLVVNAERASASLFGGPVTVVEQAPGAPPAATTPNPHVTAQGLFVSADTCRACHNNVVTPSGEDVSIFTDWRSSMMANSARDPYWMAAVRREVMDHPASADDIENECSICHMPMTTFPARAAGRKGRIFDHLPLGRPDDPDAALAADGVSCTLCHQIQPVGLGTHASFAGGYVIDVAAASGTRSLFGRFQIDSGRARVMRSSSSFVPAQATHMRQSELCATCHTLFTHSLAKGATEAKLPEQTPYLEWQQSAYKDTQSCQSCHMPAVAGEVPLTQVLGQPREGVSRHTFLGGNFFMMKLLNRYRADLGVQATPREMDAAVTRTIRHLQEDTARVSLPLAERTATGLTLAVDVQNLAGHKLPTAYPSRRAWLHVRVEDSGGRVVFESGKFSADGSIVGNDNDADATRFEPHYASITRPDQVQVYESVMVDPSGRVTTGLLSGASYAKDNRLLPRGMNKANATADVATHGDALQDQDFGDGRDRVTYEIPLGNVEGPLTVRAELWFQPIGYRWAVNFRDYDAPEPKRFVGYWNAMASESAVALSGATTTVR